MEGIGWDKMRSHARATLPAGYAVITGGPVESDDLLYCWTDGRWYRYDDPVWISRVNDAEDAVCVARRPKAPQGFGAPRKYVVNRSEPGTIVTGLPFEELDNL